MDSKKTERLMSIDALRGFDMVWIAGGATLISKIDGAIGSSATQFFEDQMHHADWVGFTFMDIIMPLFLFITGCSMVFSFRKRLEQQGVKKVYGHVIKRFFILWILGMIYQGNLLTLEWSKIDFFSNTLQAIAIGYLGAAFILLLKDIKWQLAVTGALLSVYWALMNFIPGFDLSVEGNLAIHIDQLIYPNHIGNTEYAWVIASMNFIVTVMLGVFSGQLLTSGSSTKVTKLKSLAILGIALTASGFLLSLHDPCIKKLWSSSFTLISGGYCVLLLSAFYGIIDVAGYRKWALPFVAMGKNALLVYMVFAYNRFVNLGDIAQRILFGTESFLQNWYPVTLSCLSLVLLWAIFRFLDKNKVYLKI